MSRWRIAVVLGLIALPLLILAGVGSYHLWTGGWLFIFWCVMAGCMAAGYVLGIYWHSKKRLLHHPEFANPTHWTDRDREAWKLVEERAKKAVSLTTDEMSEPDTYFATAKEMVYELAHFYHPGAKDPVGHLTIPELLAVIELASHDLAPLVDRYLPGGHLLTVEDWRRTQQLTTWYRRGMNVYWLVSALYSPIDTGIRFLASQVGLATPFQMLQQDLMVWFYQAYIHRLGTYLIDVNSGRLRVGATRYRQLVGEMAIYEQDKARPALPTTLAETPADEPPPARQVVVTVAGQVKAGKSSLINALLGEQRAVTDVLPATANVQQYALEPKDIPTRLVIQDTVGYGHEGPREDQLKATRHAAEQSDLLLLVLHATNPGRQADLDMVRDLATYFREHPELRKPPFIAVVTHIDLLSPTMEWSPPYNWAEPKRPKEQNIHDALAAVRDQLGEYLQGVVPICGKAGKVYGIDEFLLPVVAERLDELHGVGLLRVLKAEADAGKVRKVFHQMLESGKEITRVFWRQLQTAIAPTGAGRGL